MFAVSANPNDTSDQTLTNIVFFPDIVVADFKSVTRAYDSVTDQRVIQSLQNAMIDVNDELSTWRITQEQAGYSALVNIPGDMYGTVRKLEFLYKTAVYSKAKAEILENYTDADNTSQGDDRAEAFENSSDTYLREAREAIRKILGVPRVTVELI